MPVNRILHGNLHAFYGAIFASCIRHDVENVKKLGDAFDFVPNIQRCEIRENVSFLRSNSRIWIFKALMGKNHQEIKKKWKVNRQGIFYLRFFVQYN